MEPRRSPMATGGAGGRVAPTNGTPAAESESGLAQAEEDFRRRWENPAQGDDTASRGGGDTAVSPSPEDGQPGAVRAHPHAGDGLLRARRAGAAQGHGSPLRMEILGKQQVTATGTSPGRGGSGTRTPPGSGGRGGKLVSPGWGETC
ncbi:uncharacterized protein LOC142359424 isoform X1 [Opisthocomus hoazin]|uniref:uncharacterized protein LOC142359424 isoform X1 n=1 Tax=Opisthocomus hoazin TaxID=30419 RepID=UPI003F52D737